MKDLFAIFFAVMFVAMALTGCDKSEINTRYSITPVVETFNKDTLDPSMYDGQIEAFLYYYEDTTALRLGDFDEIEQGILRNRSTGAEVSPDKRAVINAKGVMYLDNIVRENFVLMLCHKNPSYQMYAWRNAKTKENLDDINVKVQLQLWQTNKAYTNLGWRIYYNNHPSGS